MAWVVNFMVFAMGLNVVSCRVRGMHVDAYNVNLHVCREKVRARRRGPNDLCVLLLPMTEHPRVAHLLHHFIDNRNGIETFAVTQGLATPGLWNSLNNEWDRYLTDEKKHATRDEYRHLLWYGVFTASAHAALTDVVATLRAQNATARDTADANDLLDSAIRTIATNGVDGLLNAMDDKRLQVSLRHAAKAQAAARFTGSRSGVSGGGSGGNIRIKDQERAEHADRATKETRADKNKDKDKIKGKPQRGGSHERKTTTPQAKK
eukprot:jgi/Tetstr1/441120/TSEL_003110.t1